MLLRYYYSTFLLNFEFLFNFYFSIYILEFHQNLFPRSNNIIQSTLNTNLYIKGVLITWTRNLVIVAFCCMNNQFIYINS